MQLFVIPLWVNVLTGHVVVLLALWKGGWRERTVAAAFEVYMLVIYTCLAASCPVMTWRSPLAQTLAFSLSLNAWLLAACLICAIRTDRYWVLAAASVEVARMLTHVVGVSPHVSKWAFSSADVVWRYAFLACLVWGVISYRRQRAARRA